MEIRTPRPKIRQDGNYGLWVDQGYGDPRATIYLAEGSTTLSLADVRVDDCDRLIRAAAEAKEGILRYQAKMTAPHGRNSIYEGTCQLCGKPEDDALHAEPRCEATEDGTRCTEAPGHDGHHYGPDTGGGIRKMWLISDATIEQARWLAEHPLDEVTA